MTEPIARPRPGWTHPGVTTETLFSETVARKLARDIGIVDEATIRKLRDILDDRASIYFGLLEGDRGPSSREIRAALQPLAAAAATLWQGLDALDERSVRLLKDGYFPPRRFGYEEPPDLIDARMMLSRDLDHIGRVRSALDAALKKVPQDVGRRPLAALKELAAYLAFVYEAFNSKGWPFSLGREAKQGAVWVSETIRIIDKARQARDQATMTARRKQGEPVEEVEPAVTDANIGTALRAALSALKLERRKKNALQESSPN
jgi:hypothetical protein